MTAGQASRFELRLSTVLDLIERADGAGLIVTDPIGLARHLAEHESCHIDKPELLVRSR